MSSPLQITSQEPKVSRKTLVLATAVLLGTAVCGAPPLFAQDSNTASPGSVQVTVTARAKHGSAPALTAQDVTVHEDKNRQPVTSLVPVKSDSSLQLAILIDSDATTRLGAQFQEINRFLQALPQNAGVAIAYAQNGSARIDQPFTTDRNAIGKGLHVTFGPAIGDTSIYSALSDLIRKWPDDPGVREVLLISDGIDPTYGLFNTQPQDNPGLQNAIRDAQKARVTVFSIFVSGGRVSANEILNLNGQGSLGELTSNTGGYAFTQGTDTPVSFRPFLNDLQAMLGQQYLLTFQPAPVSSRGFHDLKVNIEVSGVKLLAPNRVYVSSSD
jgi:VWFA-related protein